MWLKLFFVLLTFSIQPCLGASDHHGPMEVRRLKVIQQSAKNQSSNPWARIAYLEYINGLLEGLFYKEGTRFCLPKPWMQEDAFDVFKRLTDDVEKAIQDAQVDALVKDVTESHLSKIYPCS